MSGVPDKGISYRSGFLQRPHDYDQEHGSQDRNQDAGNQPAGGGEAKQSQDPISENAADGTQNNVDEDAITGTVHDLACRPTGDQAYHDGVYHGTHGISS